MRKFRVFEKKGQGSEAAEAFRAFIRGSVREMIWHVMVLEVEELCGPKHGLVVGETYRAGSSPGRSSQWPREGVIRPRVRRRRSDGKSEEVLLETYRAASDPGELEASILAALKAGVSTREAQDVVPEAVGTSRSSVSRLWCEAGHPFVDELRSSDLSQTDWVGLLLDGHSTFGEPERKR